MSDIRCAQCHEPWDSYHLRHDALSEVVDPALARKWDGKLPSKVGKYTARELLADDRWVFGGSLYDIRRCPCCEKGAKPVQDAVRDEMVALHAGDDDGLAAFMEDYDV